MKVLELFGGIGACTQALKKLNIPFEVVDYVEIDENAVKSYNAINGTNFAPQDIKQWNKDLDVDLIMHGSPCVNFSTAGKQEGGDEGSGTASSLMWETVRIIDKLRPKYVIWENVENVTSKKHFHNFKKYIDTLKDLNYTSEYKVLIASDYGIPQGRERVFTVSIRNDLDNTKFEFPREQILEKSYKDYLEPTYDREQVVLTEHDLAMVKDFGAGYGFGGYVVGGDIYPTITASYGKVSGNSGKIKCKEGYRILTPRECWRLMGFSDENFDKANAVNSDKALYKQAGNSIVVDVLEAILAELFGVKLYKNYRIKQNKLF